MENEKIVEAIELLANSFNDMVTKYTDHLKNVTELQILLAEQNKMLLNMLKEKRENVVPFHKT